MLRRGSLPSGRKGLAPALALALALASAGTAAAQDHPGKAVYDRWCAECHGIDGDGRGPAARYMLPPPRDFTQALYQIRTTASGALPTDDDILRIINDGMPGTAMPGWRDHLSRAERNALVDYLKTFSRFFETEPTPEPIRPTRAPRVTEEGLAVGREYFDLNECWRCHGQQGRGDGPSAHEQIDEDGFPIRPANLNKNWIFTGGGSTEDIYMRLRTGLDGTPMPSFDDLVESGFMTDEQLWRMAQYVRSLSPDRPPRVRDVIRAELTEDALPSSPDDPAWDEADEFYFPLAGQIIVRPRWFAPSVTGIWVSALHDGSELALRLRWHDPSRSPDPRFDEWQERVLAAMEPKEGGPTEPQPFPDAIAVQFPRRIPDGMEKPYFLMGTSREPVYLWRWESTPWGGVGSPSGPADGTAVEALARGMGRVEPLAGDQQGLTSSAVYDEGEWRVTLRRALAGGESRDRLDFEAGRAIPIAFFAWDGSNGEADARGAISTWYYIYLDQPTPMTVYISPVVAMLLTAILGVVVVARAQRRELAAAAEAPAAAPAPGAAGA